MNSLREKIKELMKERGDDWRRNHMRDIDINDIYADKTIKILEKLIDPMIQLDTKTDNKKCTMCNKPDLIKLPSEFQVYARQKNFESYFCTSCIQIINFVLLDT